ncbi:pesticin C-terminus-like muramidase [Aeromonas sp. V90_14]|uniref:pesticin C-terminus-like muramidase n=1 Tax=Aeromonas sp. V90_14 TaxID=3044241 RepID=UPI00249E5447|nr:pesticin C-terminus-like muramidase [Aeromonas sp. V90_14]MDI3432578.1 pesticin C-terminus-like muramidase [Aeromonas sp. V90_14]
MKFAFPILTATGEEFKDAKALTALINSEQLGHYLLGNHNKWHGGIHISDKSAPWCKDKYPVRAMADGKVVAFRMMKDYLTSEFQGESLRYSNCFCLVQHEYCEVNTETKAKNEFTFYSLYMHLLPWDQYQSTEKLVLKKGWNARNSVPHANPDAEQQRVDATLPRFTLPKDTELEMDSNTPPQKGSVGGKEYDFIKVTIKSQLSNTQMKEAEKAGVVVSQGSSVWIANSPAAVEVIKPNLPTWLFDQIEAELLTNMVGRADPGVDGPTGRPVVGKKSVSLPAGTKLQYDAHQLEFHWDGDKARKMARCKYVTPSVDGVPSSCGVAWVCVEDKYIKANTLPPSHLGELYVLPSPVAIAAGETIGYLGLVETPGSLIGGKKSKYQVHLEVFTQDPRLDDVLANKAGTKGGATYAKVPAELVLYEKKKQDGKDLWVATADKSLEALIESPELEKDAAKQEWLCVSSGKYVKKEQVALLSQHDWLKIGFKKVDGSGSDGYLDPDAPPTFFADLVKSFDSDGNGELSSEEIQAALQNSSNAEKLQKLIVKHPSEWYEKSSASSYLWLDKLMTKIGLPDFDLLVDHEKQRIDKLEWMQSAAKLNLEKEVWHFSPIGIMALITERRPSGDTIDFNTTLGIYKISKKSAEFILSWEAYMPKPYVPKGDQSSGVTIGYGYDLGQQESSSARTMLSDYYTAAQVERLLTAIGKKGDNARAIVHELSDISIDKDRALDMAMRLKERYCQVVVNTYPQAINLPPDSAGAILSLVYNRGPSLKKPKIGDSIDSRREMREIGDDFSKGNIKNIPSRLRSMRRLWANQRGLRDRREGEAKFIEEELARGE